MENILATRKHRIIADRLENLRINLLAYHGGHPYIEDRLCRWPSESDVDFYGSTGTNQSETAFLNNGKSVTHGRLQRAFLNNYARRIAVKINQYVLQTAPTRTGIDAQWGLDVTRTGMSINQFMAEVSAMLTVCRWCWIGIDRPATQGVRSKADVQASGDRVYWQIYDPTEVVDWSVDSRGKLAWLMVERQEYQNADPRAEPSTTAVRYLYLPGKTIRMEFDEKKENVTETPMEGFPEIPFTLVGIPNASPWWFDDVERIQRSIMDLHSSLDTSIFKTVYPVLVIPQSFADSLKSDKIDAEQARRKIGTGNPIIESTDDKGITRWLTGTATDLAFIRTEIDRRQNDLYDIVGLAMKMPESRQVASAEAKAWDHLDTEAVLSAVATTLEEAENRCIEMSAKIGGPIFTPYKVAYAKTFDLSDFATDIKSVVEANTLNLPPEAEKMFTKAVIRSAGKRFNIPDAEVKTVQAAVDAYEPPEPPAYTPPAQPSQEPDPNAPDNPV